MCFYIASVLSSSVLRHYHGKFAVQILTIVKLLRFKFINFFAQMMNNFFQEFEKMKNNLIYAEMVKVLR